MEWRVVPAALVFGALLCLSMMYVQWHAIVTFGFVDPDDALRYVEARDFAGGQNWFDVSQHRVNPPVGGPMHWSRIVDVPLAALMLLFRPLVGSETGDQLALVLVPLVLTLALCVMVAMATDRIAGKYPAFAATILIGLSLPIPAQFRPMRVDHHEWQILMSAVALWAAFDPKDRRGGILTGLAVAFWAHVSSEGLPYAAMFGAVFSLAFLRKKQAWDRLGAYMVSLTLGSAALLLGTRGWLEAAKPYCDAVSPVYLFPLAAGAATLLAARYVFGNGGWLQRAAVTALAGVACIATYVARGEACSTGPFGTLDPLVYKYWYLDVMEGRPFWAQSPLMAAVMIVPPLIGMAGIILAILREPQADRRFGWFQLLILSAGSYAVSLFVMRAISISYLMALPGLSIIILSLLPKARGFRSAPARIIATTALCGLTPLGVSAVAATFLSDGEATVESSTKTQATRASTSLCLSKTQLSGLSALRRGTILSPLDQGPNIIAFTPHSVVATAHHRNNLAIRDVMTAFMGTADYARTVVTRHQVSYVAYCPATEVGNYVELGPKGLMHDLEANRPPSWLRQVALGKGSTIKVYRVSYDTRL